jgi:hypothetical protein
MKGIEKRETGFKFGKYSLKVTRRMGCFKYNGRRYVLVEVITNEGQIYNAIRLYNDKGKFIKQLLFEPEIRERLSRLLSEAIV